MTKELPPEDELDLLSTHRLLDRAREGNDQAVEVLYRRHLSRLRRWARGRLPAGARDLMDTEDLVQQTLTKAFTQLGNFRPAGEGAFQAYLRAGILNLIRDQLRRNPATRLTKDTASGLRSEIPSPLEQAIGRERLARYERAFSELKPSDQEALFARLELGLTYEEIARDMGRASSDAARMAVKRALARLARAMAEGSDGRT